MAPADDGPTEYAAALAYRLILFGGIFIVAAMLLAVTGPAFDDVKNSTQANTDSTEASDGIAYVDSAWNNLPFFVALLGVVQLVAGAVFEGRGGV